MKREESDFEAVPAEDWKSSLPPPKKKDSEIGIEKTKAVIPL